MAIEATSQSKWLAAAVAQRILSSNESATLLEESLQRAVTPAELAMEKGLASAVQCDIVEALINPGNVAPGFEVQDVLGHGGLGVVYRARQVALDRLVALKTVLVTKLDTATALARFKKEAKAIGTFHHPNIVAAFDSGTHEGRLYLAMEMVDGEDLAQYAARNGRLDEHLALSIARQVAAGLAHAAQQEIVHRDVKPANILLTDAPEGFPLPPGVPLAKITDFGLALLSEENSDDRVTRAGTTMGTPQYMAPEQFLGSTVDYRADIFSLGATLFEMLAGHKPFPGANVAEVYAHRLQNGNRPDLESLAEHCSPDVVELVENLMSEARIDRPSDYKTIIARIDEIVAPTSPHLSSASARIPSVRRRTEVLMVAKADTLTHITPSDSTPVAGVSPLAPRKSSKRRFIWIAAATVTLTAAIIAIIMLPRGNPNPPSLPNLVSTGWERPLFDGATLDGWQSPRGSWGQARDAEGGYVLQGRATGANQAILSRLLPMPADFESDSFRIHVGVNELDHSVVHIHFGRADSQFALLFENNEVDFGRLDTEGEFRGLCLRPISVNPPEDKDVPQYHQIRIDRHAGSWLVFVDGKFLAKAKDSTDAHKPTLSLYVADGMAHFENLRLVELKEAPPTLP
jgi:serine/threonine protein kinase